MIPRLSSFRVPAAFAVLLTATSLSVSVASASAERPAAPEGTKPVYAYVADATSASEVAVVDTATNDIVANIPVPGPCGGLAITPNHKFVYAIDGASQDCTELSVINTSTNKVVATMTDLYGHSYDIAIDPNPAAHLAYVTADGDQLLVINTQTNTLTNELSIGEGLGGVAFNPAGTLAYLTDAYYGYVYVVNTANNLVEATIQLPYAYADGVVLTPDGSYAYVQDGSVVAVIDTATNKVVGTIAAEPGGGGNLGIAMSPSGKAVFADATAGTNSFIKISTKNNTVVGGVNPTVSPDAWPMAVLPSGKYVYSGSTFNTGAPALSIFTTGNSPVEAGSISLPGSADGPVGSVVLT